MSSRARVAIGVPLYDNARHLPQALDSLLGQTHRDLALVLVDDGSTDGTGAVAQRYARQDPRVSCHRNERRLGMVGNYRRSFALARALHPDCRYFAWASDHDVWHPRWLEELVAVLDRAPGVVLSYPLNRTISDDGDEVRSEPWRFDTVAIDDMRERLRATVRGMSAGNMVYGLFRVEALERAGVYRMVLLPDRLLLSELSLHGRFEQVDEVLWDRRRSHRGRASLDRQRAAFFPGGTPFYARLPWWLMHTSSLAWRMGVRGAARPQLGRLAGLAICARYLRLAIAWQARRRAQRCSRRVAQLVLRTVR